MTFPITRLFLHFFDTHFFDDRVDANPGAVSEAWLATRLALMLSQRVFVPAASYVENPHCRSIVDEYSELFENGAIVLVGSEQTLSDYATAKLMQYDEGTTRHLAYQQYARRGAVTPSFRSRSRDTTAEIGNGWRYRATDLSRIVRNLPDTKEAKLIERNWTDVPEALAHRAFITDNVVPILGVAPDHVSGRVVRARVGDVINEEYFNSFVRELGAAVMTDLGSFAGYNPEPDTMRLDYGAIRHELMQTGMLERVAQANPRKLRTLHERDELAAVFLPLLAATTEQLVRPGQLELPVGRLKPAVEKLATIKSGKKNATTYARAVQTIFAALFPFSLEEGIWEKEINEGRKRIDIVFPNRATDGAFLWARQNYAAKVMVVECKNYSDDPGNPEVDQLAGRMAPHRSMFGVLACRKAKNLDRLMARCIAFKRDLNLLLIPLTDADLVELADSPNDPGVSRMSSSLIGRRMLEIATA